MNITKLNKKRIIFNLVILNIILLIAFVGISFLIFKYNFKHELQVIKEKQKSEVFGIKKIFNKYYEKNDKLLDKYLKLYEDRISLGLSVYSGSGEYIYPSQKKYNAEFIKSSASGFFFQNSNLYYFENYKSLDENKKAIVLQILLKNTSISYLKIRTFRSIIFKGVALYLVIAYILSMLLLIISRINYDKFQTRIFGDLIKQTNDGVIITDVDGYVVFANDSFIELFKVKLKDILGNKISKFNSFIHDEEYFKGMLGHLKREGSWEGEVMNNLSDGSKIYTKLKINSIVNKKTKESYNICIYENNTSSKLQKIDVLKIQLYDSYTGLPNKVYAGKYLEKLIDSKAEFVYLNININNFKEINDNYGYEVGDKLLLQFIEKIKEVFGFGCFFARVDGRKIGVVAELTGLENFEKSLIALNEVSQKPFKIFAEEVVVHTGIVAALQPEDQYTLTQLMELECEPCEDYLGEDKLELLCGKIREKYSKVEGFIARISDAIENNEFSLSYQPRVNIKTNTVVGAEAFLRWSTNDIGKVSPLYLIPAAENAGLIDKISIWTIKELCKQIGLWQKKYKEITPISLNTSILFLQDDRFIPLLKDELKKNDINASQIQVEISEKTLGRSCDNIKQIVNELSSMGVDVLIDNFGTGNSKLEYLKNLNIKMLKIDREFIKNFPDTDDGSIAKLIIDMAKSLEIEVVGEGTETVEQINLMKRWGCELVQGYYYSKAVSESDFTKFLENKKIS